MKEDISEVRFEDTLTPDERKFFVGLRLSLWQSLGLYSKESPQYISNKKLIEIMDNATPETVKIREWTTQSGRKEHVLEVVNEMVDEEN
jgi:hypothetical protein